MISFGGYMAVIKQELSIRGESIQRIYSFFKDFYLIVNRKYQRKLVWTVEEKKSFIESIFRGYPVPLFLFAEVKFNNNDSLEIIDGLQRLNSITSFIEQEFDFKGEYYDLETMAESKLLLDKGELKQKFPKIDRELCAKYSNYPLPFSIYKKDQSEEIDEVFRRINSGGRQLSRQDIRQSGSTGHFANVVRKIAAKLRGDDSASDRFVINDMKNISISNIELEYGINVENIFWVKQSILPKEKVRESRDEEVIADMLAYMLLKEKPYSAKVMLDTYYGIYYTKINEERFNELEQKMLKISPEKVIQQFLVVYEQLKKILNISPKQFNKLMFPSAGTNVPRYFQSIFLAMHEMLILQEKIVVDYQELLPILDGIGKHIDVGTGAGGVWTSGDRTNSVNAVVGIIKEYFKDRKPEDPALNSWTTELENILMQSFTEQPLYEFKQGVYKLYKTGEFDKTAFLKIVKTMTAIANQGPGVIGYLILGIADNKNDGDKIDNFYNLSSKKYNKFFITGIEGEATKYHGSLDDYFTFFLQKLKKQPVDSSFVGSLTRDVRLIGYFDKSVLVFKIKALENPVAYDDEYYGRCGTATEKIQPPDYPDLFKRFYIKAEVSPFFTKV